MIIRLDYDNDCIKIGSDQAIGSYDEKGILVFNKIKDMNRFKEVLCEVVNMIVSMENIYSNRHLDNISIDKQDEGQLWGIEEY